MKYTLSVLLSAVAVSTLPLHGVTVATTILQTTPDSGQVLFGTDIDIVLTNVSTDVTATFEALRLSGTTNIVNGEILDTQGITIGTIDNSGDFSTSIVIGPGEERIFRASTGSTTVGPIPNDGATIDSSGEVVLSGPIAGAFTISASIVGIVSSGESLDLPGSATPNAEFEGTFVTAPSVPEPKAPIMFAGGLLWFVLLKRR